MDEPELTKPEPESVTKPKNPLWSAYGTVGVLLLFLFLLSNVVSIPFIAVSAYDKMIKPMLFGKDAVVTYRSSVKEADLIKVRDNLSKSMPEAVVTLEGKKGQGHIKIHAKTGSARVTFYQSKLYDALDASKVEPWLFGPVTPDYKLPDTEDMLKDPLILVGSALALQISILLLWLIGKRSYFKGDKALPPFHTGKWLRPVVIGMLLGPVVAIASNYLDSYLRYLLHVPEASIWDAASGFPVWGKIGVVLCGVIGAPILEEIFFRGMLMGVFQRIGKPWVGVAVSSVIFGVAHFSDAPTVLTITVMGAVLAIIYMKTKSLYTTMTIHMVNNALSFWLLLGQK